MRHAHIVLTAVTLLLTSFSVSGCAGTRSGLQADAALARNTKKPQEETSLGWRAEDPAFLFANRGKSKSLVVKALAYTGGCSVKSKRVPRGAWGDPLTPDVKAVAVSPDLLGMGLEYGDTIRIEGLPGEYRVLDVMHGRHAKAIDIFYGEDHCGARQWGKRTLTITWQ